MLKVCDDIISKLKPKDKFELAYDTTRLHLNLSMLTMSNYCRNKHKNATMKDQILEFRGFSNNNSYTNCLLHFDEERYPHNLASSLFYLLIIQMFSFVKKILLNAQNHFEKYHSLPLTSEKDIFSITKEDLEHCHHLIKTNVAQIQFASPKIKLCAAQVIALENKKNEKVKEKLKFDTSLFTAVFMIAYNLIRGKTIYYREEDTCLYSKGGDTRLDYPTNDFYNQDLPRPTKFHLIAQEMKTKHGCTYVSTTESKILFRNLTNIYNNVVSNEKFLLQVMNFVETDQKADAKMADAKMADAKRADAKQAYEEIINRHDFYRPPGNFRDIKSKNIPLCYVKNIIQIRYDIFAFAKHSTDKTKQRKARTKVAKNIKI